MTELMSIKETMSSLQIAEITEKRHDAVLRDIRNLLDQGVGAHNFVESSYNNSQNKELPCFILTKKGCLILASGYNALLREKIINRWEELELQHRNGGFQIPQTLSEALMLAAEQTKQLEQAKAEKHLLERQNRAQESLIVEKDETIAHQSEVIREQADKVEKYDIIYNGHACYRVSQLATMFGFRSAVALNKVLKDLKIQHYINGQWILNADYQGKGYTHVVTNSHECSDGSRRNTALTVWTEPGRVFLYEKLKKAGYIK